VVLRETQLDEMKIEQSTISRDWAVLYKGRRFFGGDSVVQNKETLAPESHIRHFAGGRSSANHIRLSANGHGARDK